MEGNPHLDDEKELTHLFATLQWVAWEYHPVVGSTNDIALGWAKKDAPDWGLVIADQQTAGRGRGDRGWVTRPGSALAISLVMRPTPRERQMLPRFTALATLGLVEVLGGLGLQADIKWPNDVLLDGKKVAGVLVETEWRGDDLAALVVGLGVNVLPESLPSAAQLRYPAISVAEILGKPVDRWALLVELVGAMKALRPSLTSNDFVLAWNKHLAFRDEVKSIALPGGIVEDYKIIGVTPEGALKVRDCLGGQVEIVSGEIIM
ncbi:MAG: biotin--[acetyl-CoA-carboxylase] ligase [Chloroflexota bacterium]|nr:biotin--[acetyl-CoA-carboxylase] ligase [Chloroflexota bacterium]